MGALPKCNYPAQRQIHCQLLGGDHLLWSALDFIAASSWIDLVSTTRPSWDGRRKGTCNSDRISSKEGNRPRRTGCRQAGRLPEGRAESEEFEETQNRRSPMHLNGRKAREEERGARMPVIRCCLASSFVVHSSTQEIRDERRPIPCAIAIPHSHTTHYHYAINSNSGLISELNSVAIAPCHFGRKDSLVSRTLWSEIIVLQVFSYLNPVIREPETKVQWILLWENFGNKS